MNAPAFPRTIVLVGMMGAGKTTTGNRLAVHYGLPFFDSDQEIERRAGQTTKDYFAQNGEPAFRQIEAEVMADLLAGPPCVIAAAGGAFMREETRRAVRENALSVWLTLPLEINFERAKRARPDRPILQKDGDPQAKFLELYALREPFYRQADIAIDANAPVAEVVSRIVAGIEAFSGQRGGPHPSSPPHSCLPA